MKQALLQSALVGIGGGIGALLRFGLSGLLQRRSAAVGFPLGTLSINLVGCLSIGLFVGLAESRPAWGTAVRTFALIGVLGGFTTYSAFGYESFSILRNGEPWRAALYIGLHLIGGLILVALGYYLGRAR